jgi:hypothetical protein
MLPCEALDVISQERKVFHHALLAVVDDARLQVTYITEAKGGLRVVYINFHQVNSVAPLALFA